MSVEQSLVLTQINAGVARLTLNRPHQYNALSSGMLTALRAALQSGKRLLQSFERDALATRYAVASANMAADLQTNDAKSGIDAFLHKAPTPLWTHR